MARDVVTVESFPTDRGGMVFGYETRVPQIKTDEDAFHAHLADHPDHPDDHGARLAFADWLEERAGLEECKDCYPPGSGSSGIPMGDGLSRCQYCSGTGRVPDRYARLSAGYRTLGEFGLCAWSSNPDRHPDGGSTNYWFGRRSRLMAILADRPSPWVHWNETAGLPDVWFNKIVGLDKTLETWKCADIRRAAEDAAAEAWSAMTDAKQEQCRRELEAPK